MSQNIIPYTHWAYFPSKGDAQACAAELTDYATTVDPPLEPSTEPGWLLRATRDVQLGSLVERHEEVRAVVDRHGGIYDGGHAGW